MTSAPPEIGQPTREARTGREDRGQRGNKWWTLVAVCLGTFMLLLDITIVQVALPDIQQALHSSFADLQWVVDAYALTLAAFGLSASIFSVLLYLVLYLQDILGYWPSGHSGNSWTACYRDCVSHS